MVSTQSEKEDFCCWGAENFLLFFLFFIIRHLQQGRWVKYRVTRQWIKDGKLVLCNIHTLFSVRDTAYCTFFLGICALKTASLDIFCSSSLQMEVSIVQSVSEIKQPIELSLRAILGHILMIHKGKTGYLCLSIYPSIIYYTLKIWSLLHSPSLTALLSSEVELTPFEQRFSLW